MGYLRLPHITLYLRAEIQDLLKELASLTHTSVSRVARAAIVYAYQHKDDFVEYVKEGGGV